MMIADEGDGLLKFLDAVSYQLACLLDVDGQRQDGILASASSKSSHVSHNKSQQVPYQTKATKILKSSRSTISLNKSKQQPSRATKKRRQRNNNRTDTTTTTINPLPDDTIGIEQNKSNDQQQLTNESQQQQTTKLHQHLNLAIQSSTDTHTTLDGRLTLNIGDDMTLDNGVSISPSATHLSPIDPSMTQFCGATLHQSTNYYMHQRSATHHQHHHLDSYQIHDEFATTGHETIPIASNQTHLTQEHQPPRQIHLVSHQQQHQQTPATNITGRTTDSLDGSTLTECYPHQHHHHHHPHPHTLSHPHPQSQSQHHPHPHPHSHPQSHSQPQPLPQPQPQPQPHLHSHPHPHPHPHHQQQHHPLHHIHQTNHHQHHQLHHHHQVQYHQPEHQWLGQVTTTPGTGGDHNSVQLDATDPSALDQVVSLSPPNGSQQSIDQVHFAPLYHHSYYSTHQTEQLDSFQHLTTDEFATNSSATLTNASSPINHVHHIGSSDRQQQQNHSRINSTINGDNGQGNNTNTSNNYEHQHHSHHQQHGHQQSTDPHQLHDLNPTYHEPHHPHHHHHHHHHQEHHHHHLGHQHQHQHHGGHHQHVMPLMNGIEPSSVILQDINLASATWSSPEDLYSI